LIDLLQNSYFRSSLVSK